VISLLALFSGVAADELAEHSFRLVKQRQGTRLEFLEEFIPRNFDQRVVLGMRGLGEQVGKRPRRN
jgi:hypothetical protein